MASGVSSSTIHSTVRPTLCLARTPHHAVQLRPLPLPSAFPLTASFRPNPFHRPHPDKQRPRRLRRDPASQIQPTTATPIACTIAHDAATSGDRRSGLPCPAADPPEPAVRQPMTITWASRPSAPIQRVEQRVVDDRRAITARPGRRPIRLGMGRLWAGRFGEWLKEGTFTNSAEVLEMDALNMLNANFDVLNRKLGEMNMNATGLGNSTYDWWGGDYHSAESQSFVQDFEDDEMLENIIDQQDDFLSQPKLNSNEFCEAITLRNETQMEDQQDNNGQVLEKVADKTDALAENELINQSEEAEKEELKTYKLPSVILSEEKAHQVDPSTFPPTIRYVPLEPNSLHHVINVVTINDIGVERINKVRLYGAVKGYIIENLTVIV
ncbi:hypothetical protein ACLOJK_034851 [Asimina triloba]